MTDSTQPDSAAADAWPLPPDAIPLGSAQGGDLLAGAEAAGHLPLSEHFAGQSHPAYCGVASAVIILNALRVPAPSSSGSFDQRNVFDDNAEMVVARSAVEQRGMSLDELGGLLRSHGVKAEVHHVADGDIDSFRRDAIAHLGAPDRYMVVNYLRATLGQKGGGHISPLAAYHAPADRLLLLDVSRDKYPPLWVTTQALFTAMNTLVPRNMNRSRGYVSVSR